MADDIYVAIDGSDGADGSIGAPFATLNRAAQEVATIVAGGLPVGGIVVHLRGGTHQVTSTVALTSAHSGTATNPVVWKSYDGEQAFVTGAQEITGWSLVTDPGELARLSQEANGSAYRALLSDSGITDFGEVDDSIPDPNGGNFKCISGGDRAELTYDKQVMQLARWPKTGFLKTGAVTDTSGTAVGEFVYAESEIDGFASEPDMWAFGHWKHQWASDYNPVANVNTTTKQITLTNPHYTYGFAADHPYYLLNIMSALSQPGDWYLDRVAGVIYFWPLGDISAGKPSLSMVENAVTLNNVEYNTFDRSLMFEATRGVAIYATDCTNCTFGAATQNVGGYGLRVTDGSDCLINAATMTNPGDGAVYILAGDRITLTNCNHIMEQGDYSKFGRWNRTNSPAAYVVGCGATVRNCNIYDGPHQGIRFNGNNHTFEKNNMHHLGYEASDAGAIYTGADWSYAGNVVQFNYIHHCYGFEGSWIVGMYLDDIASGVLVTGNTFYDIKRPILLGGGRNNTIVNNAMYSVEYGMRMDSRCEDWAEPAMDAWFVKLNDMPYQTPPWSDDYPYLVTLQSDEPEKAKYNLFNNNIVWVVSEFPITYQFGAENYITPTNNILDDQDPLFVDPDNEDFNLQPGSPMYGLGWTDIDYTDIGPTQEPVLSNPTVDPSLASCDLTVESNDAVGTLYAAVRDSGAYQAGDEELIKNGTGAVWYEPGGKAPVAGVNTFTATGLSEDTIYYAGFAQEQIITNPNEHEFNADLGWFTAGTFSRGSTTGGFDKDGLYHEVAVDQPVFQGCGWGGSDWTPDAAFDGLVVTRDTINLMVPNYGFASAPWATAGVNVSTTVMRGEMQFDQCTSTTTNGAACYVENPIGGGPADVYWGTVAEQGDASQITLEMDGDVGRVTFDWNTNAPTVSLEEFGATGSVRQLAPNVWAFYILLSGQSTASRIARVYPHGMGTIGNGDSTLVNAGSLLNDDAFAPQDFVQDDTGRSIPFTVAEGVLPVAISQDFSIQYLYQNICAPTVGSALTLCHFNQDAASTTNKVTLSASTSGAPTVQVNVANTGNKNIYSGYNRAMGAWVNLRLKREGDSLKLWVDDEAIKTTTLNSAGPFSQDLTMLDLLGTNTWKGGHILKKVRVYNTALDDSVLEGWT